MFYIKIPIVHEKQAIDILRLCYQQKWRFKGNIMEPDESKKIKLREQDNVTDEEFEDLKREIVKVQKALDKLQMEYEHLTGTTYHPFI